MLSQSTKRTYQKHFSELLPSTCEGVGSVYSTEGEQSLPCRKKLPMILNAHTLAKKCLAASGTHAVMCVVVLSVAGSGVQGKLCE